ncbi:Ankyrin repeat domain-containing protein 50-like protein 3 [Fusarium oxysporum f. sp. phaseoli]
MVRSFPSLKFALMVGIGGGAPTPDRDIRLGDVVASVPRGKLGGVVQCDFGKRLPDGRFQLTGQMNSPPEVLLGALPDMQRRHNDPRKPDRILEHLKLMDDMPAELVAVKEKQCGVEGLNVSLVDIARKLKVCVLDSIFIEICAWFISQDLKSYINQPLGSLAKA